MRKLIINGTLKLSHLYRDDNIRLIQSHNEMIEAIKVYTYQQYLLQHQIDETEYGFLSEKKQYHILPHGTYDLNYCQTSIQITFNVLVTKMDLYGIYRDLDEVIIVDNDHDDYHIIDQLVRDAIAYYKKIWETPNNMLEIYTYKVSCGNGEWKSFCRKDKRPVETLYIDSVVKECLFGKVDQFIQSKDKYILHGIPYKFNILLTGTPGMGKSTIASVLASRLDRSIYVLPISQNMNNLLMSSAISEIPDNSILLCEDIDCAFVNRATSSLEQTTVTLSSLLNILDGVLSKPGLITIMTTNFREKLDCALKRAGRVDFSIDFQWATRDQVTQMLTQYYPNKTHDIDTFMSLIKDKKITVAKLQNYFFYVVGEQGDPMAQMDQLLLEEP